MVEELFFEPTLPDAESKGANQAAYQLFISQIIQIR